jgi:cytochrome b561
MKNTAKINIRPIVSISLFCLIILLFITAVIIQIIDGIIDPEIYISLMLDPEGTGSYFLAELQHIVKAVHVVAGFLFMVIAAIHLTKNWKVFKGYFRK